MLDRRRHAPVGRIRTVRPGHRTQGLPHVYRGRARRALPDIYDRDHGEARRGGFRWLLSTCLAATVGAVAIGAAIFGSIDGIDTTDGVIPAFEKFRDASLASPIPAVRMPDGLNWSLPKSDRLQVTAGAMAARHIIHEQIQVRRDNRPFIQIRPYMRVVARLAEVPPDQAGVVPAFNPFRLYATAAQDQEDGEGSSSAERSDVAIKVVELFGGILPGDDGQELEIHEVAELVARAQGDEPDSMAMRPSFEPDGSGAQENAAPARAPIDPKPDATVTVAPNTTLLTKSVSSADEAEDLEETDVRVIRAARGDTLVKILQKLGADGWQARGMQEAARSIFPDRTLSAGYEVHVTLVPTLANAGKSEPARFSIFAEGHEHKVTVYRDAAGEFVASSTPYDAKVARAAIGESDKALSSSLYASIYQAALQQGVPADTILQILRIHAHDTDFRQRVRHGDSIDLLFDVKEESGPENAPGELLYAAITTGGEVRRFWRYRTPDGSIDYYDDQGNNSRKFLMRRPIRGENIRLTSGFGMRQHPILNISRMHTGIDWAGPIGTPILAAGNGTIEEAKRKGQNGNYVRIRHANGYQSTYSHMQRFETGIEAGAKVKQGQVIGYVGMTGLTSGPHLHYEVLVNSRYVDALQIQVPRARQLIGRQHADYQKERARIDDIMRRTPVLTASR